MERYKEEFIEFMVDSNVLKFGDFTLKSGRKSPSPSPIISAIIFTTTVHLSSYLTGIMKRKIPTTYGIKNPAIEPFAFCSIIFLMMLLSKFKIKTTCVFYNKIFSATIHCTQTLAIKTAL